MSQMQNADIVTLLQQVGISDPNLLNNTPFMDLLLKQQIAAQDGYQVMGYTNFSGLQPQ